MRLDDYAPCQDLADAARAAGVSLVGYASVRDPLQGANWAVLDCGAITTRAPTRQQTWRYMIRAAQIEAVCEMPRMAMTFRYADWAASDPRIPASLG